MTKNQLWQAINKQSQFMIYALYGAWLYEKQANSAWYIGKFKKRFKVDVLNFTSAPFGFYCRVAEGIVWVGVECLEAERVVLFCRGISLQG